MVITHAVIPTQKFRNLIRVTDIQIANCALESIRPLLAPGWDVSIIPRSYTFTESDLQYHGTIIMGTIIT